MREDAWGPSEKPMFHFQKLVWCHSKDTPLDNEFSADPEHLCSREHGDILVSSGDHRCQGPRAPRNQSKKPLVSDFGVIGFTVH